MHQWCFHAGSGKYGLESASRTWRRGYLRRVGQIRLRRTAQCSPLLGPRAIHQNAIILLSDGDATASGPEISSSMASNQCTSGHAAHAW